MESIGGVFIDGQTVDERFNISSKKENPMPIAAPQPELGNVTGTISTVAVADRLAEIERVLIEICDREGIAFNVERPDRKRVLRNVSAK